MRRIFLFQSLLIFTLIMPCLSQERSHINKSHQQVITEFYDEKFRLTETQLRNYAVKNKLDTNTATYKKLLELTLEKSNRNQNNIRLQNDYQDQSVSKRYNMFKLLKSEEKNLSKTLQKIESEAHIAINPKDENNLVATAIRTTSQSMECPIYYTLNGGETWNESTFNLNDQISGLIYGGGDPFFTSDADGNFFISWITIYVTGFNEGDSLIAGLYYAKSQDKGITWEYSKSMNISEDFVYNSDRTGFPIILDKEWLTCDRSNSIYRNNLYCSFTYIGETTFIGVAVKRPNDLKFSEPLNISGKIINDVQFSNIEVDKNGIIYCTFYGTGPDGHSSFWVCKSIDGGESYDEPNKITDFYLTNHTSGSNFADSVSGISSSRLYPCPQLAIDNSSFGSSGNLYFTFTAQGIEKKIRSDADIYFTKSTDAGITWSYPKVLHQDPRRHQYYSTLQVNPNGVIVNNWYDRIADPSNKSANYVINFSNDAGESFTQQILITQKSTNFNIVGSRNDGFGVGDYNGLAVSSDFAFVVWGDGRSNNGDIELYFAKISVSDGIKSVYSLGNNNLRDISFSPNPAIDRVKIEFEIQTNQKLFFNIYSKEGKLMLKTNGSEFTKGKNLFWLDIENLHSGNYICKIESDYNKNFTVSKELKIVR